MVAIIPDGSMDFLAGQDASKLPDRIAPNAYAAGVNITTYQGIISPRWGWDSEDLHFPDGGVINSKGQLITYKFIFESCKKQHESSYIIDQTLYILVVVAGVIFLIDTDSWVVTIPELKGEGLDPNVPTLNGTQADKYYVIFDFPNYPIILDGLEVRRADPDQDEIPISLLGTFNQNRLFISNAGREFTASDSVGNLITPDAPITFFEVQQPASPFFGQVFSLPTGNTRNRITAMGFVPLVDSSTGIGPLFVATQDSIFTYQTNQPRTGWEAGQFGSITVANAGIAGAKAFTSVNSDTLFMSGDGQLRSLSMSRDEQFKWSRLPISREVENYLKFYDVRLARFAQLSYFRNKVFVTANPTGILCSTIEGGTAIDYCHQGMVVMELDNLSSFGETAAPSFAGVWTGIRPSGFITFNQRMFAIGKDDSNKNRIYELNTTRRFDVIDKKIRIVRSVFYSRSYSFQDPFSLKELHSIDLDMQQLQGDVKIEVRYKPSHGNRFAEWRAFNQSVPWSSCKPPFYYSLEGLSMRDFHLGSPTKNDCNEVTKDNYTYFRKVQLKFTIKGVYWELLGFMIKALLKPEADTEVLCKPYKDVPIVAECNTDWIIKEDLICQTDLS